MATTDPYRDPNATPTGSDAVWNSMLGQWMSTSGNPYSGTFGSSTPTVNTATPGSASDVINQQNPTGNPDQPFVQAGDTGGYLEGVGVTLGEGTSQTAASRDAALAAARAAGVPDAWAQDFLARNPGDEQRLISAYQGEQGGGGGGSVAQQWNSQPSVAGGGPSASSDPFLAMLMERIGQGPPDANDPNVRAQADAFAANQERARRNYLSDLAEQQGPFANLRGEQRMAAERYGATTGAFEAELIGREIEGRRDEIMQALSLYGSRLSDVDRMALERELADLQAALAREGFGVNLYGMDLSNDQFLRELAQRQYEFDSTIPFM